MNITFIILSVCAVAIAVAITSLVFKNRVVRLSADLDHAREDLAHKELEHAKAVETARANYESQLSENKRQYERNLEDARKTWNEQQEIVKNQFSALAGEVLEKKSESFQKLNQEKMDVIVNPLKDALTEMKTDLIKAREKSSGETSRLEKAIESVLKQSQTLGEEANRLANAMSSKSEVQGIWGEMILEEILSSQGLEEHKHYDLQQTLRDGQGKALINEESGKKMKPDAILYYPDNKCVIVDSKVSLNAFMDYCNAQKAGDEDGMEKAVAQHMASVRQHIKELADKDYSSYVKAPYQSLSYVIMFMPSDSALQLALCQDSSLWRGAFERGVFITSEQNLVAACRMIEIAWTNSIQVENQQKIYDAAQTLLDRVTDYCNKMTDIGGKIGKLQDAYDDATKKLYSGRQSVVGAANKLKELGAKTSSSKTLPEAEPDFSQNE
ncbi:MAG: DNA recombination protein RmuC [Bacteroidales bacterium]|nr:DNA recombination protein RmuC [Bacteroidales bacterium]